jgi:hypothetical protein
MTTSEEDRAALEALEVRLLTVLPEEYHDAVDEVAPPVPMRSAGLKYGMDGKVAWNEIWGSFCDLAMAGGPPHKGTLLTPGSPSDIDATAWQYRQITDEICRGVTMATEMVARVSPVPGWVRVECVDEAMAGWLLRAITMENVAVRRDGVALDLPAAPTYRLEKEIKNVVTVIAKTCHYWLGHMPPEQREAIADLFAELAAESPLIEPDLSDAGAGAAGSGKTTVAAAPAIDGGDALAAVLADAIKKDTGLERSPHHYAGWLGVVCPDVRRAIWMMRALVVSNVLSRREGTVLFVPINPVTDPHGRLVARAVARIHHLALARDAFSGA